MNVYALKNLMGHADPSILNLNCNVTIVENDPRTAPWADGTENIRLEAHPH